MYCHILTSIIGNHPNIQDAIKFYESDDTIVAVVADGLGSRKMSAHGARLICKLMVEELSEKKPPLSASDILSPKKWQDYLESSNSKLDEFCTTCSFALINKSSKEICVGQIGDSPIFIKLDNNPVIEMRQEKEFANITDSLGGKTISDFIIHNYKFKDSVNVLVTSDGIGDELNSSSLDSLFLYLTSKYQKFTPKSRSRRFTKEMKATIGKVNHDDKSAIYIWSI